MWKREEKVEGVGGGGKLNEALLHGNDVCVLR